MYWSGGEGTGEEEGSRHGLEQTTTAGATAVNIWDMRRREGAGIIIAYRAPDTVLSPPTLEERCD